MASKRKKVRVVWLLYSPSWDVYRADLFITRGEARRARNELRAKDINDYRVVRAEVKA